MTEGKKEFQKREKHHCIKCKSSFGYLRIKTKEWICRACGNADKGVVV